ncbi:hypothetical protein SULI_14905 [Saccharolobus solfataricus]|uniref:Uncharacterized protein n=3 Tax=Saccharolobus solfataricus TaxID=2287 RepID=Q97WN5_SACS2|nr:hypothetical protein [Saccharolobus solfataricus]AAK42351.1 Hypothetical protein SSO2176 [Saccharolobus solfataricus P2]AKA74968.1 hypothetical protein SULB_2919 [Saccharolobus solfataricus]AKA77664.1 hypothetical protein SULC_2916 [Saccharolobus solfataricus]AKA80355.1 hypothetical protein SULA_2919 [Saccharolobus solfataricus]AZF69433.1 hypothetical protein SULG_14905 [Saccharolobus solfataricus]
MVYQLAFIFLILLISIPLSPHQSFSYNVQIIYNNTLYLYVYNYTILSISPLTYNFTIYNSNGSIIYNKVFTISNYSLFPPALLINASLIGNYTLILSKMENNTNISVYKGFLKLNRSEIVLNLIYHNNILYQANGTSKNVHIYIFQINSENESPSPTIYSYLPLIVLLIVIIVAVILLIKIGKI